MTTRASSTDSCDRTSVPAADSGSRPVGEVMVRKPKTLPIDASAAQARELFTNPKVLSAVLVDGTDFAGMLDPDAISEALGDEALIAPYAQRDVPTITPDRPVGEAAELLRTRGALRLAVVQADGHTLAGLLCVDHERTGFCQG